MFRTAFKSIFDTIEETEPLPTEFSWKEIDYNIVSKGETKYTKTLYIKRTDGSLEEGVYCLQPFVLYKTVNPKTYMVSLKNTRIVKVNDSIKHLYGIRILGMKGQEEIYALNSEDQNNLFTLLKNYCTCLHLMNEFNLVKIIGRGNFSKVHLGSRLGTSQKCAIKSIEKNKILESIRNMVFYLLEITH